MLGLYIYPPPKGTEYTAADLEQPDKVIELFGYCGILEGLITKEGWDFLIQLYGYEKPGMWFDAETIEEYMENVQYERAISPDS